MAFCFTSASASWNQFQGNSAHTGYLPVVGPSTDALSWQLDLGANIHAQGGPSVGYFDGSHKIIIGADDGVHIISPAGYQVGHIPTSQAVTNVVAIADNTLFFSVGDSLYAYQPSGVRWVTQIDGYAVHVATRGDSIYVCDEDHIIKYTTSGLQLWQQPMSGDIYNAAPAVDEQGNVYAVTSFLAFDDFAVYAFHPDGSGWWYYDSFAFEGNGVQFSPTIDTEHNVYVATRWSSIWPAAIQSVDELGRNWKFDVQALRSSPALCNNTLYFGVNSGLHARTSTNGAGQWTHVAAGRVTYSSPAIDVVGSIYFGSDNGRVTSLTSSGGLRWTVQLSGTMGSPALGDDGALYIAAGQQLYCFGAGALATPEVVVQSEFRLWPNPVHNATVYLSGLPGVPYSVYMYDVSGRLIRSLSSVRQIPTSDLPSGVYFVQLKTDTWQGISRLIVEK